MPTHWYNILLIDFYLLKLLLKLSWFYWAIVVSISGHKIVLRICKLCLWTLLIYYRQLSFCEFASIHGSKSFPTMLRTDKKTNQADYRSDFPSLENLHYLLNVTHFFGVFLSVLRLRVNVELLWLRLSLILSRHIKRGLLRRKFHLNCGMILITSICWPVILNCSFQ